MHLNKIRLFDHLVGANEQRDRHGDAERLGSLQVDNEIVFGRKLHRQLARILALEDAINVSRRLPVLVSYIRPVGDKSTAAGKETMGVDGRQPMPGR